MKNYNLLLILGLLSINTILNINTHLKSKLNNQKPLQLVQNQAVDCSQFKNLSLKDLIDLPNTTIQQNCKDCGTDIEASLNAGISYIQGLTTAQIQAIIQSLNQAKALMEQVKQYLENSQQTTLIQMPKVMNLIQKAQKFIQNDNFKIINIDLKQGINKYETCKEIITKIQQLIDWFQNVKSRESDLNAKLNVLDQACPKIPTVTTEPNQLGVYTPNAYNYQFLTQINANSFILNVKASNDAHIGLFQQASDSGSMYEIVIGGWGNSLSVIRKEKQTGALSQISGTYLSSSQFKTFWFTYNSGLIKVGTGDVIDTNVILSYQDPSPLSIKNVAVSTGWGSDGQWTYCVFGYYQSFGQCYKDEDFYFISDNYYSALQQTGSSYLTKTTLRVQGGWNDVNAAFTQRPIRNNEKFGISSNLWKEQHGNGLCIFEGSNAPYIRGNPNGAGLYRDAKNFFTYVNGQEVTYAYTQSFQSNTYNFVQWLQYLQPTNQVRYYYPYYGSQVFNLPESFKNKQLRPCVQVWNSDSVTIASNMLAPAGL